MGGLDGQGNPSAGSESPIHDHPARSGGGDEIPLAMEVAEIGDGIRCELAFAPARFGRAAVVRPCTPWQRHGPQ